MKDKKPFIIQLVIGVILIVGGLITQFDYYSNMLFALGCGLALSSIVQTIRIAYWQNPKRQTAFEEKRKKHTLTVLMKENNICE